MICTDRWSTICELAVQLDLWSHCHKMVKDLWMPTPWFSGHTINSKWYTETLMKLRETIRRKRSNNNLKVLYIYHDNVQPHTSYLTNQTIGNFGLVSGHLTNVQPESGASVFHSFSLEIWWHRCNEGGCDEVDKTVYHFQRIWELGSMMAQMLSFVMEIILRSIFV